MIGNPFLRVLQQMLALEKRTGVDQYGAPIYAAPVDVACRWRAEPTRVQTATGVSIQGTDVVWIPPDTGMKADDRITLPSSPPRTVLVRIVVDPPGPRGEIYLQRAVCL